MIIDDRTKISLYAVAGALPFIVGGILWLSSVASDAKEAKQQVQDLRSIVEDIHDRIIRIEEQTKRRTRED